MKTLKDKLWVPITKAYIVLTVRRTDKLCSTLTVSNTLLLPEGQK